jgi:hypothetical protein
MPTIFMTHSQATESRRIHSYTVSESNRSPIINFFLIFFITSTDHYCVVSTTFSLKLFFKNDAEDAQKFLLSQHKLTTNSGHNLHWFLQFGSYFSPVCFFFEWFKTIISSPPPLILQVSH